MKGRQIVAMLAAIASHAEAFAPRKADPPFVVAAHPHARTARMIAAHPPVARAAFDVLAAAGWQAIWDRDTGVPTRLWGGFVDAPGSVNDGAIAERAARLFLASHIDVLAPGAQLADFVRVSNQLDGNIRTVGFEQTANGLPVIGGQIGFVFEHDRLFAIGSEALPNVRVAVPARTQPLRSRAEAWVTSDTGLPVMTRAIGERAILPIIDGGSIEYHVVDVLDVESRGLPGRWDVYVAADGTPLARRNRLMFANGTLVYDAGVRYADGARMTYPAAGAQILVDGAATVAGADGSFAWTGTSAATVVPGLVSAGTKIINIAGTPATATLTAQPAQPVAWSLATDEFGDAQLSTFVYAHAIVARDLIVNPAAASWLNQQHKFYVNEYDSCNAYSTGDDVHLFRSNAQCENTGRLADVVYHEFGHSLHNHSVIAGIGVYEATLSEGLADYNAANFNEDSGTGRGFYFNNAALREIDPIGVEKHYPDDLNGDSHISGEIISGALWDLRKALIATLGHDAGVAQTDKIFAGIMQRAADMPTSYVAALIADDDDGNLGNNTPHFCAIQRAFGVHGLVPGGFPMATIGPHTVNGLSISIPIEAPSGPLECPPANVTSVAVTWKIGDGPAASFPLASQGALWTGTFPEPPPGTVVLYTITVAFDDGSKRILPNNPADPLYQLFVGDATPLFCEPFDSDPHWSQHSVLVGDSWQFGVPNTAPESGDPAGPYTGMNVFGTTIYGIGHYRATEMTYVETPAIDVSKYETIRLQYRRWLAIEDAKFDHATIEVNGTTVWENPATAYGTLDHIDKEWRFHDVDITAAAGTGSATVRWTLASDSSNQFGGWTIDDVCVVGLTKKCGNGALDPGEECDDGNAAAGDGCSATCTEEITAGGGGCCSAESHPASSLVLGFGVLGLLARRRKR
ncbi:MAG: cysteine-rich repeat protein [Myxococcales bacterium]|nr:cysteine-rich repeat protein [Myxococcales bacterium]